MIVAQNLNQQKMALQEEVISRTQDLAIKTLEEEFERAKMDIQSLSCLLYTSPSPRDRQKSRMPSSA